MKAPAATILTLALALFVQACTSCSREEAPELFATEEQITRTDVVAVLGEPLETIKGEDRHVDVYEYDRTCGSVRLIAPLYASPVPVPYPAYEHIDQVLIVEYGPDGSFLSVQVLPNRTPEQVIASHKRGQQLNREREPGRGDPEAMYEYALAISPYDLADSYKFFCLAAHMRHAGASNALGNHYRWGIGPVEQDRVRAYLWYTLNIREGSSYSEISREMILKEMTHDQIAEAERLVADWEPNPAECEEFAVQTQN